MQKYPFIPELLDTLPEELAELYRALEDTLLDEICSRLKLADQLNEVTVQDIRALRSHGIDLKDIEKAIRKTTGISEKKLKELLDDVVDRNQRYYTDLIDLAHITQPETFVSVEDTWAIYERTKQTMRNLTRSMGFLVDAGRTMLPPAKAYQWALDNATMQIQSGAISYNQAIKSAVQQLAQSGLKVVDYESGHRDQIDVAARRAVMTGVNQICDQYTNQSAEYLGTRYFEVSAHSGARDKPGPSPWSSHKDWQGKVYYESENGEADPLGLYKDLVETTGYGHVDGLTGANCRHHKYPFIPGVSERTYTDEQLEHIDDGLGCTFDDKTYTAYEATQEQRKVERTIRKLKREKAAYKAAGLTEEEQAVNIRLRRLNAKYKAFSKAAGLPEQRERMKVLYADDLPKQNVNGLAASTKSAILKADNTKGGGVVHHIGRIDVEKYRVVTEGIRTDEVVITDERIQHIRERHPQDFERYEGYLTQIIETPDYILEANKPNTAFLLKTVEDAGERFQLILRLATNADNPEYKNSVITFLRVEEKRYKRYLRTKKYFTNLNKAAILVIG